MNTPSPNVDAGLSLSSQFWPGRLPGLARLWQQTRGSEEITVAVLDGAVDLGHPGFAGARVEKVESIVPAEPFSEHGTGVASLLFGQGEKGMAGLAPGCRGLLIPVFAAHGSAVKPCSQVDLARAIELALQNGANIINISGGQLDAGGEASPILARAIRSCSEQGVLVVAAAGNDGCDCLHVPAAEPSVLAVGAMDEQGRPIEVSNWGETYRRQGIVAPGQAIPAATLGGGVALRTGTSWATPVVSAIAALLLSLQREEVGAHDARSVREILLATARGCDIEPVSDCRRLLVGRLDVAAATTWTLEAASEVQASGCRPCALSEDLAPSGSVCAGDGAREEVGVEALGDAVDEGGPGVDPAEMPASKAADGDGAPLSETPEASADAHEFSGVKADEPAPPAASPEADEGREDIAPIPAEGESLVRAADTVEASGDILIGDPEVAVQAADVAISSAAEPCRSSVGVEAPGVDVGPPEPAAAAGAEGAPGVRAADSESQRPHLVYALGQIGYDFGTESRRDSFVQSGLREPHDSQALLSFLAEYPSHASGLTFTLLRDNTPVYAIEPRGPFAAEGYRKLRGLLAAQLGPFSERASIPGWTFGAKTLMNGQVVPTIYPELRGVFGWSSEGWIRSLIGVAPKRGKKKLAEYREKASEIESFLERVFYEIRNLGHSSPERALNYTVACSQIADIYSSADENGLKLEVIGVEPSPVCRLKSDCWDVKLTFFHPAKRLEQARKCYRFTIDVSDVVPVTVGSVRDWHIY